MNTPFQNILTLVGRVLLVALFLPAGISKITGFAGTAGWIASVGLPAPQLATVVAILVEVVGSVALLVGFQTRIAALVLAVFTLVATVIFHAFWALPADQQMVQQLMFFKNFAVIGGLLVLAASGPGALSIEGRKQD
jgi:putative oxidoreductase